MDDGFVGYFFFKCLCFCVRGIDSFWSWWGYFLFGKMRDFEVRFEVCRWFLWFEAWNGFIWSYFG